MMELDTETIINGELNPDNKENMCFTTTPLCKLVILSVITLGFYDLIWAYNLWRTIKIEFGYNVNALLRTIFMGITNFSLFNIINKHTHKCGLDEFNSVILATIYIILCIIGNIYNSMSIITLLLTTAVIAHIQKNINKVNETNFPNAKINYWNYSNTIWTTIFVVLYFLIILNYLNK